MKAILIMFICVSISSPACAFVIGGTNLGITGYPDASCFKPPKPIYNDSYSIQNYNSQFEIYINCIKEYLDNAKNDINRIKEKYNEVIEEAKRSY